jgi:general secretion pathway protein M
MNAFWAARTPSERTTLLVGGTLAAILLLVALVWLPLERNRVRLTNEIPKLSASIAAMERQAAQVARVRSLPALDTTRGQTPSLGEVTATLGKGIPSAQVSALDDKRVRILGTDVPYGALLETVAAAQSVHGLRVDTARIDALPAAGRVSAELVLSRT